MTTASAVSTANGRFAFVLGGSLLIASAVLALLRLAPLWTTLTVDVLESEYYILPLAASAMFAAAVLVFAWGWRGEGSVVARRPFGLLTLSLFGVWNLMIMLLVPFIQAASKEGGEAMMGLILLPILAPIVATAAVLAIAQAGAVAGWWRWMPALALCPYLILVVVNLLSYTGLYIALMDFPFEAFGWAIVGAQLLLGIGAIALARAAGRRSEAPIGGQTDPSAIPPAESAESAETAI